MLSHVIPWTSARQTPLSMDFSRQEYWSGLPFPSPLIYIFYVDQFFKVFIEFVTILLLFCVLVFWPLGKWDLGISLVAQTVNNPPAMQETQLGSPGWEDPPEKGMAPHSSIFAWRVPWTEFTVHGVTKSQA